MITQCVQRVFLFENLLPRDEGKEEPLQRLEARKLLLQRSAEAAGHILNKRLEFLDPSVGDQACQIRALRYIQLLNESREGEMQELGENCFAAAETAEAIREQFFQLDAIRDKEIQRIRTTDLAPLELECKRVDAEKKAVLDKLEEKLTADIKILEVKKAALTESGDVKAVKGLQREIAALKKADKDNQRAVMAPLIQQFRDICALKVPHEKTIAALQETCRRQKNEALQTLDFSVSRVALEVVQGYILTITREQVLEANPSLGMQYHEHLNAKKLELSGTSLPARLISGLLDCAKKGLQESSLLYVQEIGCELGSEEAPLLRQMVSTALRIEKRKREELPFYYLTEVIFRRACELNVPVLLMVRNIDDSPLNEEAYVCRQLFMPHQGKYEACNPISNGEAPQHAIYIKAFSRARREQLQDRVFQNEMISQAEGLEKLIAMNAVQHTQYTDQTPQILRPFDRIPCISPQEILRLTRLNEEALAKGFSNPNPSLCCIDHIYCGRLHNAFRSDQ